MTFELFITILVMSASATSISVQIIKSILDKIGANYSSMPIAVVSAFLVGAAEIAIYYVSHNMLFSGTTILYAICMGAANAVGTTTSYDLVKKFIYALLGKAGKTE